MISQVVVIVKSFQGDFVFYLCEFQPHDDKVNTNNCDICKDHSNLLAHCL